MACANLRQNRIGELAVFRNGDSAFDLFYKYSASRHFCMHSDWAMDYMITYYSGQGRVLGQLRPRRCKDDPCDERSITCHNHGPKEAMEFLLAHPLTNG
jgi:hypothetical protein